MDNNCRNYTIAIIEDQLVNVLRNQKREGKRGYW